MRVQVRFFAGDSEKAIREIMIDCSAAALIPVPGDSVLDNDGSAHRVTSREFHFDERSGHRVDVRCE